MTLHSNFVSWGKQCNVQFEFHTPPTGGVRISLGVGGSGRPKKLKKCMNLNRNFQIFLPWGRYGYFLELHNQWLPQIFKGLSIAEYYLALEQDR